MKPTAEFIATRNVMVDEIKSLNRMMNEDLTKSIKRMKAAKTINDLMTEKQTYMLGLLSHMPVGISYCYFCLKFIPGHIDCSECGYGKVHGVCSDDDSDYNKMMLMISDLEDQVCNKYYTGEETHEV